MTDDIIMTVIEQASEYPWFASFLLFVGALRLAIKPAMVVIRLIVKYTNTDEDDKALDSIESSKAWAAFCWIVNLVASIKIGTEKGK